MYRSRPPSSNPSHALASRRVVSTMFATLCVLLTVLELSAPFINAIAVPATLRTTISDFTPLWPRSSTLQLELGPLLSKNASIYFPNSAHFGNLTQRWSAAVDANFAAVVVPGIAKDVAATVGSSLLA